MIPPLPISSLGYQGAAGAAHRAGSLRPAGDLRPASAAAAGRTDCDHSSTIPGFGVRRSTYRSQDLRMTVVTASVGDAVASDCSGQ